ncbi:hypothetical protein SCHPADRAFT_320445 [Schizopora paradoxa]|uniref:Uncharacterized protein n=1 Tax=Schizopora paradoxa TaxID=27342 RepID=A0A0H2RR40_9AGAM|nr:hypothetical protein SCHPADRAFT_320445 [Schizopora paradoxa]
MRGYYEYMRSTLLPTLQPKVVANPQYISAIHKATPSHVEMARKRARRCLGVQALTWAFVMLRPSLWYVFPLQPLHSCS